MNLNSRPPSGSRLSFPKESRRPTRMCSTKNVGDTSVTSMTLNRLSIEKSVLEVVRLCSDNMSSCSTPLIESLIWPFIAKRSLRSEPFSSKEWQRFINSMQITARLITKYESEDTREQNFIKYWIDYYLWLASGDTLPPTKPIWIGDNLFSGWCRRFVCRAIAKKDFSFLYSLQKGSKQMWPPLKEANMLKAISDSKLAVAGNRRQLDQDLTDCIRETSSMIFETPYTDNRRTVFTKFLPSGSSCLQASRRDGGALSLVSRFQFPRISKRPAKGNLGSLRQLDTDLTQWRTTEYGRCLTRALDKQALAHETDDFTPFDVKFVGLYEPAKIRPISIGDGDIYTALQPLQGFMLNSWKNCWASTMREDDLFDRVNTMYSRSKQFESEDIVYCSVDYKSATDLLKREATHASLESLKEFPLYYLLWDSMNLGSIIYPDGDKLVHTEGQFMGHPCSFPILCIINLACFLQSLDDFKSMYPSSKPSLLKSMRATVMVNGDDMLFFCPRSFVEVFRRRAIETGFVFSAGKNYVSKTMCVINSQMYSVSNSSSGMIRRGYLNLKLVKGTSLKDGVSAATPDQLGKDINKMVTNCPWTACAIPSCFNRFTRDWKGWFTPNWYLPAHLGGYGVDRQLTNLTLEDIKVTRSQRKIAARFISEPGMVLYRRDGMTIPAAKYAGAMANWRYILGAYVPEKHESFDNTDDWLARVAYAARASAGSLVSDEIFISKFSTYSRLKPISLEVLALYESSRLIATNLPPCPPICDLRDIWSTVLPRDLFVRLVDFLVRKYHS